MSKPRGHHYIPQFLLKAFASRITGNEHFVDVFAKGRIPYQQNVRDVAKQRDFHGHPDESSLEEVMSQRESVHSEVHRRLLQSGPSACTAHEIHSLIIHLLIRSKHLRESMTEMGEMVFDSLQSPTKKTRRQFQQALEKETAKVLRESEEGKMITLLPKHQRRLMQRIARAKAVKLATAELMSEQVGSFRQIVDLSSVVASSHIKTLSKDHLFEKWHERFTPLEWKVVESAERGIILGD